MTHEDKEEKLHLIQLDYSKKSDYDKIMLGIYFFDKHDDVGNPSKFDDIMYSYCMKNEKDFRQYLEDSHNLEQEYIDEKWEE